MSIHPAVVLEAVRTVEEVLRTLSELQRSTFVVLRRQEGWYTYHYAFLVEDLRLGLAAAPPGLTVKEALNLRESQQSPVEDAPAQAVSGLQRRTVLLDDREVIGVFEPDRTDRSRLGTSAQVPPEPVIPPGYSGFVPIAPSPLSDTAAFQAYPQLDAPEEVTVGAEFNLTLTLADQKPLGHGTQAVIIAQAPPEFVLSAQVIAPGFELLSALQQELTVLRNAPEAAKTIFRLRALDPEQDSDRREMTVFITYAGQVLAQAWRDVLVVRPGAVSTAVAADPRASATPLANPQLQTDLDLAVLIERGRHERSGELIWRLVSPHSFTMPALEDLESATGVDDGRRFAADELRHLASFEGELIQEQLLGLSTQVRDAMPVGFFTALNEIWQVLQAKEPGRVPTVLLISSELYVPWELAKVDATDLDPTLLDDSRPPTLGAQVRVGRWVPADRRRARQGPVPILPPPLTLQVQRRVVIVGNYGPASTYPQLEFALEEGRELLGRWKTRAVLAQASVSNVSGLLKGTLLDQELQPIEPTLLHFACHAAFDPAHRAHGGMILEDGRTRLTPAMFEQFKVGQTPPFVFFNACQAALPSQALSDTGGFARVLLRKGCVGFIAPLWNVSDDVARHFAQDFYNLVEREKMPVAEALRTLRRPFAAEHSAPPATLMAYTYYGHPDLRLTFH